MGLFGRVQRQKSEDEAAERHPYQHGASASAAPTSNEMFEVGLNFKANEEISITFEGSPPRVSSFDPRVLKDVSTSIGVKTIDNFYVVSLHVLNDALAISSIASSTLLQQLFDEYKGQARMVVLSSHPISSNSKTSWLDEIENKQNQKKRFDDWNVLCKYQYALPTDSEPGLVLQGFPLQLVDLAPDSALNVFLKDIKEKTIVVESVSVVEEASGDTTRKLHQDSPGFDGSTVSALLKAPLAEEHSRLITLKHLEPSAEKAARQSSSWASGENSLLCCCME